MAFCKVCGNEMHDSAIVCTKCGVATANYNNFNNNQNVPGVDNGGFGWGLLACCFPVVGLILYLVWKDTKPNTAKSAGTGLIVFLILFVLYIIALIGLGFASDFMYY